MPTIKQAIQNARKSIFLVNYGKQWAVSYPVADGRSHTYPSDYFNAWTTLREHRIAAVVEEVTGDYDFACDAQYEAMAGRYLGERWEDAAKRFIRMWRNKK
jgi:hypothetical protein